MRYKVYQLKRIFDKEEDAIEYKSVAEEATGTSHMLVEEQ